MSEQEIGDVRAATIDPEDLADVYTERTASEYGGYFPDQRGVSYLGADFVKAAAAQIQKQLGTGETVEFQGDASDETVANMREELKIDSYRTPLLAIARATVDDWIKFQFVELEQAPSDAMDPKKSAIATLFKAYETSVLKPVNDEKEAALNTAAFLTEGDELQSLNNTIAETNVEHLSGKHMQDGVFLVYDGTKYSDPLQDPNMVMFE
ncbi:hypothetical protein [Bifidobacterium choloepi]|uniref:Uncharacterized protein n=1 Tax=Bifidobacterium choloepi TaxID=2614131 RepID=A0A6I5N130_9BIFI|nr:hypothetical protein [Bifidobacterium choloepi]NEG69359.1 hypothetical protein [Bifidobacterium choloepi]